MVLEKDKLRRSMDFFWETEFQNSKVYDVWTSVCPQFLIYFLLQVGGTYVRVLCCVMEYRVTNSNGKRTKQLEEKIMVQSDGQKMRILVASRDTFAAPLT